MKEVIKRNQAIGKRIKSLMAEQGISQKEMCEKMGVVRSTMNRYLYGDFSIKPATLKSFADALGMTVDELLGGTTDEE